MLSPYISPQHKQSEQFEDPTSIKGSETEFLRYSRLIASHEHHIADQSRPRTADQASRSDDASEAAFRQVKYEQEQVDAMVSVAVEHGWTRGDTWGSNVIAKKRVETAAGPGDVALEVNVHPDADGHRIVQAVCDHQGANVLAGVSDKVHVHADISTVTDAARLLVTGVEDALERMQSSERNVSRSPRLSM